MSGRKIVLVSGLAGSGTSRVSEYLHRAGVEMVVSMAPPPTGTGGYIDWEDFVYMGWCGLPSLRDGGPGRVLEYMQYRFSRFPKWGLKSPLLLPHLDIWRMIAKQMHAEVEVVLTQRAFDECQESITRTCDFEPMVRDALLSWNKDAIVHWQRESKNAHLIPFGWDEFPISKEVVESCLTAQ